MTVEAIQVAEPGFVDIFVLYSFFGELKNHLRRKAITDLILVLGLITGVGECFLPINNGFPKNRTPDKSNRLGRLGKGGKRQKTEQQGTGWKDNFILLLNDSTLENLY